MASGEELLASIHPEMKLTKNFFIRIYGYELTWPGFANQALNELENAGCSSAREYYKQIVGAYEKAHEKVTVEVARWLKKQENEKKGRGKDWKKRQEAEQVKMSRTDVSKQIPKW